MIKRITSNLIILTFLLLRISVLAQDIRDVDPVQINNLKREGKLTGKEQFTNSHAAPLERRVSPRLPNTPNAGIACSCWVPRDATWQVAQFDSAGGSGGPGTAPDYRNDDWSTKFINLPFSFCFYDSSENRLILNNNGNVSFDAPYSTFTSDSFPDASFKMIAPFWGDVDTRGTGSGIVYYKITPTYAIFQWDQVGYYDTAFDKLNTFQLILTDGLDPILGHNKNVGFCYQDMQWTTGGASGGTNGFGGTPATVGVNEGNGVNFIQFGRFDTAGTAYDGPFLNNDGVDWLDNQSFTFNVCVSDYNIPPVLNSLSVCDTIRICENTTYRLTANYLSPEPGEITNISLFAPGMTGMTVVSNTPGNTAKMELDITGQASNVGFHTISLTATDNAVPTHGSTNNLIVIEVMPAPMPSFTFSPASPVGVNNTVSFSNTSPAGYTLTWDFGDNTPTSSLPNPQHTYTATGIYTVTLTATTPKGCTATTTQQITVLVCSTASFTITDVCENTPTVINYTGAPSAGAVLTWDFAGGTVISGSGQGPYTVVWNTPGTYNPSLSISDPLCNVNFSLPINIFPTPVASIATIPNLCPGDTANVNFNGVGSGTANYTWNFGTGTVVSGTGSGPYEIQWNAPGNERIDLIVAENGCSDTTQYNVLINPIPTADFTMPATACTNQILTVNYIGNADSTANYDWNFDSGGNIVFGTGQGPYSVNWSAAGNYNVTLSVTNNGCISPLYNLPIVITQTPTVSISPVASMCEGTASNVSFTGSAGGSASYTWNFGNATVNSGSGSGPYSVQWNAAGQDQVHLTVSENGCTDSSTQNVTIYPIPTSNFIVNNSACVNQNVSLSYTGTASATGTYNWTFNSGTVISGSGQGPYTLVWNNPGSYQVSLVVTENGCVSSQTDLFATVNPLPTVFAGLDQQVCSGALASIGDSAIAGEQYLWSPATNVSNTTISNPTVTPVNNSNANQTQTYTMQVTDANGCINTDNVDVLVYPVPAINYSHPKTQCLAKNQFAFDAISNIPAGVNFQWTLSPEASIMTTASPSFTVTYSSAGTFPVTLNATYNGCPAAPYVDSVTIYAMPTSDFQPLERNGCTPLLVHFANSSLSGNSYKWSFGDGTTDQSKDPIHVFNDPGTYSVSLTAITDHGCSDDILFPNLIEAYSHPKGQFTPNPQVADILAPLIQFQNYSSNAATFSWDFGDSTYSNNWNPSHMYSDIGDYNITLYLSTVHGCVDTVRGVVTIEENFSFYIPNAFTPNGDGINDYFRGYGRAIKDYMLDIYDRWGVKLYSTDQYDKPWDGRVKNNPVQNDTYVYRIEVVDNHSKKHTYVGKVSVVQ